ncbi:unnamed protein product [Rhizophagus irregularis]|uniref:Secreted protein n=1 Tax=Rhizophagus irregularis TaxID=588596 RepID=A0A915ZRD3_9GLOM|nr:unnamed protein product [Rhizophagus irregularis]
MKSSIEDIQLLFTTTVLALRLATIACTRSSTATSGGVKDEEGQKTQDKKMKNSSVHFHSQLDQLKVLYHRKEKLSEQSTFS